MPVSEAGRAIVAEVTADPAGTLLATDVDGTLSPIVPDPDDAGVLEAARRALTGLDGRLGTLAAITGRPVGRARQMLGLDDGSDPAGLGHMIVLGQYGVERYDAASGRVRVPDTPASVGRARALLTGVVAAATASDPQLKGADVEIKGSAVALHTRRAASPHRAWEVLAPRARRIGEQLGLFVEEGRMVVELAAWRTTKADALQGLVDGARPRTVLMCGDDLGDLPAMDLVARWTDRGRPGARVVSWSAEQPAMAGHADVLCDGPKGVAALLSALAEAINVS